MLFSLPREILNDITSYLDYPSLFSFSNTSKENKREYPNEWFICRSPIGYSTKCVDYSDPVSYDLILYICAEQGYFNLAVWILSLQSCYDDGAYIDSDLMGYAAVLGHYDFVIGFLKYDALEIEYSDDLVNDALLGPNRLLSIAILSIVPDCVVDSMETAEEQSRDDVVEILLHLEQMKDLLRLQSETTLAEWCKMRDIELDLNLYCTTTPISTYYVHPVVRSHY